ncbi:hypothetical protein SALBM217S_04915 [Streptomyces griseoloalbus]
MDLPAELDEDTARGLVAVLAARSDEDQTALRGRTAHIGRLVRAPLAGRPAPGAWRTSGAALVTGGPAASAPTPHVCWPAASPSTWC